MVRAAVVRQAGADVVIEDVVVPEPDAGEVRVRVAAAGVCHSDLSFTNGTVRPQFPVVLGHEASGTVMSVGDGVTRWAPGDRVVLNWAPACGDCWFCAAGEPWLCRTVERAGVTAPRGALRDGTPVHVALGVGAFAEQVVVPQHALVALPDGVPLDLAALLGCAVLTGVGAVQNAARVQPGQSVAVIGLGGIGLSVVAGARLAAAGAIIAVDVSAAKEPLARAQGATDFVVPGEALPKQIRALTGGRGADHVFECVGRAATIRSAWEATRRGGECTVVGLGRRDDMLSFNALEILHFARTLRSSLYGSGDPDREIPALCGHVLDGSLDLASLVTHRVDLTGLPEAFDRMRRGEGARSVVVLDPAGATAVA